MGDIETRNEINGLRIKAEMLRKELEEIEQKIKELEKEGV